jgi:DNA mismatch repair protein MutS
MGQFDLVIGNPPWGKTKGRAVWSPEDTRFGDFILAGDGNGRKAATAEAMALESALRVLRPGGKIVFLLPAMAFETRGWARYNRDVGPYEASREFFPFDVTFARTKVSAGLATIIRNDTPFPDQVFDGGDESKKISPPTMYQQYQAVKAQHPDSIVLFRLGDFYEAFGKDAEVVARELDLVLTSRPIGKDQRVALAGIPYHVVEGYVARLIEKGYHVALAEQTDQGATLIEEPKVAATPESEVPEEADPTGYEAGKGSAIVDEHSRSLREREQARPPRCGQALYPRLKLDVVHHRIRWR